MVLLALRERFVARRKGPKAKKIKGRRLSEANFVVTLSTNAKGRSKRRRHLFRRTIKTSDDYAKDKDRGWTSLPDALRNHHTDSRPTAPGKRVEDTVVPSFKSKLEMLWKCNVMEGVVKKGMRHTRECRANVTKQHNTSQPLLHRPSIFTKNQESIVIDITNYVMLGLKERT